MSRAVALLLFVSLYAGLSHGTTCSGAQVNFWKFSYKGSLECPGDNDAPDKTYCCEKSESNTYCCTAAEFAGSSDSSEWKIWAIVLVVIFILVSPIIVCVSCVWCSCCLVYQNRHRGEAYRRRTTV